MVSNIMGPNIECHHLSILQNLRNRIRILKCYSIYSGGYIHNIIIDTRGNDSPGCLWNVIIWKIKGAPVCMSQPDMPVYPGDVIICRRSCAKPDYGLFVAYFLPHVVAFSIHRWCQAPPCGGKWCMYRSRSSGQNALTTCPWVFCWSRGTVLVCAKS